MQKNKLTDAFIIGTFVSLYIVVSLISTIHVIDFFRLSNPNWLAISLAIAFELGAAASLAALIALKKMSKWMVWSVFILLAGMQMMGNAYYAYSHLQDFQGWSELFGLAEEELIYQKRVLSIISGAILPLIALGFIKSLVDYIRPDDLKLDENNAGNFVESTSKPTQSATQLKTSAKLQPNVVELKVEGKLPFEITNKEVQNEPTVVVNSEDKLEDPQNEPTMVVNSEDKLEKEKVQNEPTVVNSEDRLENKIQPESISLKTLQKVLGEELASKDIVTYHKTTEISNPALLNKKSGINPQVMPGVN